jgi:hypothetical protein
MSSGEPSATKPRGRLALEIGVEVHVSHSIRSSRQVTQAKGPTDAVDSALSA